MDSYFYLLLSDRIYRIVLIIFYSLFPEEIKNTQSPPAKNYIFFLIPYIFLEVNLLKFSKFIIIVSVRILYSPKAMEYFAFLLEKENKETKIIL